MIICKSLMVSHCLVGSLIIDMKSDIGGGSRPEEETIKIKRNGNWIFIC